jgi:hypothetical protein
MTPDFRLEQPSRAGRTTGVYLTNCPALFEFGSRPAASGTSQGFVLQRYPSPQAMQTAGPRTAGEPDAQACTPHRRPAGRRHQDRHDGL